MTKLIWASGFSISNVLSLPVPAPVCSTSTPSNGGINITWSFLHTGGQPLTEILITYVFKQGSVNMTELGPEVDIDTENVVIPSLVAGFVYIPIVNASNEDGSTAVECPAVTLELGIPQDPTVPTVTELGGGRVRVTVRTLAAGVDPAGGEVSFVLTETRIAQMMRGRFFTMALSNYRSGEGVDFNMDGLVIGDLYMFSVTVSNEFGMSGTSTQAVNITGA